MGLSKKVVMQFPLGRRAFSSLRWKSSRPGATIGDGRTGLVAAGGVQNLFVRTCQAARRRLSKRPPPFSHVASFEAVDQVGAGTDGDGHHRERRILARRGDEAGPVHDEKILHVVRLIEWIQ